MPKIKTHRGAAKRFSVTKSAAALSGLLDQESKGL